MALPVLTPEQRKLALEKAAAARRERAEVKAKLKSGALTLEECLSQSKTNIVLGKMKVSAMIEALPSMGKVKAQKLMEELQISPTRRLRGLGDKQVVTLKGRFEE